MIISNNYNYISPNSTSLSSLDQTENQKPLFFSELPSRNLSELLPKEEPDFRKALVEYSLLLISLKQTIEALENRELIKFDALVGENLCQIRATIIPLIFHECSISLMDIKAEVDLAIEKIKKILVSPFKNPTKLKTLLANQGLEICLSAKEILFVEFYILTVVKKQTGNIDRPETTHRPFLRTLVPEIPEKKLSSLICDKFTDKLVKNMREEVSKISAPFLRSLAFELGDRCSFEMLAQKNIALIEGRECPPTYWVTKIIVQAGIHHRIPVVLWVKQNNEHGKLIKEFCTYFESDKSSYIKKSPLLINGESPAIVVQAICHRKRDRLPCNEISDQEIELLNLDDYLFAHGASHRQYPDSDEDIRLANNPDDSFYFYQKKAIEWKCTKNDPHLLYIYHIYADCLGNVKPIKYELSTYLEATYGDFYREVESSKLKELAKKLDINCDVLIEGKKLIIELHDINDYSHLEKALSISLFEPRKFLHQIPKIIEVETNDFKTKNSPTPHQRIQLETNWTEFKRRASIGDSFDPLILAVHHKNPVKFLTDHQACWRSCFSQRAIPFLTSKPENFNEPDVMNLLSDRLQNESNRLVELRMIIEGISKALNIPELKERALNLLIDAAFTYGKTSKNYYLFFQREVARKALRKFIHEDRIRNIFQQMLKSEPVFQLKVQILNILEDISHLVDKLEATIKYLSLSWNFNAFINEEVYKIMMDSAVHKLLGLILSVERDKSLRIVAIRYLSNFFSTFKQDSKLTNLYIDNKDDDDFSLKQAEYRKLITQFLKEFSENEAHDADLRAEATFVRSESIKHIQKIDVNYHSPVNMKKKRRKPLFREKPNCL